MSSVEALDSLLALKRGGKYYHGELETRANGLQLLSENKSASHGERPRTDPASDTGCSCPTAHPPPHPLIPSALTLENVSDLFKLKLARSLTSCKQQEAMFAVFTRLIEQSFPMRSSILCTIFKCDSHSHPTTQRWCLSTGRDRIIRHNCPSQVNHNTVILSKTFLMVRIGSYMDSHLLYKPSEDTATIATTLFIHCRVLQFVNEFGDFFGGKTL